MKKLIAIILALVMVLSLAACAGNKADAPAADAPAADAPVADAPVADEPADEPIVEEPMEDEPVVMNYAEYAAAELDTPVVIDCYVQAHQGWWFDSDAGHGKLTVYAADADGAYFLYELNVAEEDVAKFTPGTMIRVTGYKGMWDGQVEVMDGTYEFIETDALYIAEPIDGNALLGSADMINYMNQLASFKGMTLESKTYKNDGGDDIWLTFSNNGVSCSFTVEVYFTGTDSEVYTTVDAMEIGDVADIEAFLYWYQDAADCHIAAIIPAA